MPIAPNTQFDHYEILAPIGKGGMGEVFRARDTRLNREVAFKVLPASFAQDADRLRRFEQEAKATSALNHPNILTVHDFGLHEGAPFIVMELLEGTELREPITHGALPVRKAIDYAQQIAAGLTAAHEKGIVHRDLKPENLFVTKDGRVKILDFGLAKLTEKRGGERERGRWGEEESTLAQSPYPPISPSPNPPLTIPGTIMGTVAYMSPEQVRGEVVDHRSDIFSFGLILFEMLRGERAFQRETMAETMTAILKDDPPELSETNAKISPQLERLVRRCLEKKPERRFQTASDLGFALESLTTPSGARLETVAALPAMTEPIRQAPWFGNVRLAWVVAALLLLAALLFAVPYFRRAPAESQATYTSLALPEKASTSATGATAISPDGRRAAMVAVTEGVARLWIYSFEQPAPVMLAGTEGARYPFWSPNGRSIGFFAQGKLKRIEVTGGAPTALCDVPNGNGGTWGSSGDILFSPTTTGYGLYRISEAGGAATPLTNLDPVRLELGHNYPGFLPDGRHFLFFVYTGQPEYRGIRLGSLDSPQNTSFLLRADANAEYSAAGYLLFVRGRKILAQPFDAGKLALSGEPVPVSGQVPLAALSRYVDFSVYSDRMLLYGGGGNPNTQLVWFDRNGRQLATVGPVGEYQNPSLSPDGGQVILDRTDPQLETRDLWQLDLRRETFTRLTSNPGTEQTPIWAPDGNRVAFTANGEGFYGIYRVGGGDKEELLLKGNQSVIYTYDWSRDGKFIVYRKITEKTGNDISLLSTDDRRSHDYVATQFAELWAKVSPDGRWLAYQSNESGRNEIYVQSFPEPGRKVTVSQGGGQYPRWRRDGKEMYYVGADDKLMAVPVATGVNFTVGAPVVLFEIGSFSRRENRYVYDVSADGQKILVIRPLEDASTRALTVVQNWTELLKR